VAQDLVEICGRKAEAGSLTHRLRSKPLVITSVKLLCTGHMMNTKFAPGNSLADEMNVKLNMVRLLMVHRIACHVNGGDVVAEDHHRSVDGA
jgi:hypothetical protein